MNGTLRPCLVFVAGLIVGAGLMAFVRPSFENDAGKNAGGAGPSLSAIPAGGGTGGTTRPALDGDPDAARAIIASLEADRARSEETIAPPVTMDAELAKALLAATSKDERRHAIKNIARQWLESDPAAAMAWIETLDTPDLLAAMSTHDAIVRMSEHAPGKTAELLGDLPQNNSVLWKYDLLADKWSDADPNAAIEWASSLELGGVKRAALESVFANWASTDPEAAMSRAIEVSDTNLRRDLLAQIATEAIRQGGVESVLALAEQLDDDARFATLATAMGALGREDVEASRQLLESLIADIPPEMLGGPTILDPLKQLAAGMFAESPAEATEWALAFESGGMQQHAIEGIAREWIREDMVGASEWIETLPDGRARNGAIYHLVQNIERSDPATAFQWAASITDDPEKRRYLLKRAVHHWKGIDAQAALAAINSVDVPDHTRDLLLDAAPIR